MVLRKCSLRDTDLLYIQIGNTRLVNLDSIEDYHKGKKTAGYAVADLAQVDEAKETRSRYSAS